MINLTISFASVNQRFSAISSLVYYMINAYVHVEYSFYAWFEGRCTNFCETNEVDKFLYGNVVSFVKMDISKLWVYLSCYIAYLVRQDDRTIFPSCSINNNVHMEIMFIISMPILLIIKEFIIWFMLYYQTPLFSISWMNSIYVLDLNFVECIS